MPPLAEMIERDSARLAPGAQVRRGRSRAEPADFRGAAVLSWGWDVPSPAPGGAEQRLLDAVWRAARVGAPRLAVALHLGRLRASALRPHHRRVARALMESAARRHDGNIFALRNGDLVLLCHAVAGGGADDPAALPALFARLLAGEDANRAKTAALTTLWRLPDDAPALAAYARARLHEPDAAHGAAPPSVAQATPGGSARLVRHSIVRDGRPVLRRLAGGGSGPDADATLLALVASPGGLGGPLDVLAPDQPPCLIALGPEAAGGDAFAALAARAASAGRPLGVEIAAPAALADATAFAAARDRLADAGAILVVGGVPLPALPALRAEVLRADLIGLAAPLPSAAEASALDRAITAIGPARLILDGAGDPAAHAWAEARGVAWMASADGVLAP